MVPQLGPVGARNFLQTGEFQIFMSRRALWSTVALLLLARVRAHAGATLLLEEPYSYDGTFAGTGFVRTLRSSCAAAATENWESCSAAITGLLATTGSRFRWFLICMRSTRRRRCRSTPMRNWSPS